MRNKLQKFTAFSGSLLPHETAYLLKNQQFEDQVRLAILEQVHANAQRTHPNLPYDTTIDKRKYSHIKNWITDRLAEIDVDAFFEWLIQVEQQIITDNIDPDDEKKLLQFITRFSQPGFYFTKFYEVAQAYRHFLLIRMRYDDHKLVNEFLNSWETTYLRSKSVSEKMHSATAEIVEHYSSHRGEPEQWDQWLSDVFYDESLDGLNRYYALVRLTFLYLNYRRFDSLLDKFDYLDRQFSEGKYYSKRLLLNYYHNRMLLHAKFHQFDKATYYGYLSIRTPSHDSLLYINNLGAILLRQGKEKEAFQVIKSGNQAMKLSKNFHNRIGYVSFYIKCLISQQKYRSAESYAEIFLQAYRKQIFAYRWHLFFTSYLEAILLQEKYEKVVKVVKQYKLLERDAQYKERAVYLPNIPWYHQIAKFKVEGTPIHDLKAFLVTSLNQLDDKGERRDRYQDLISLIRPFVPGIHHILGKEWGSPFSAA